MFPPNHISAKDDPLNYSQVTESHEFVMMHQRLPDSLESGLGFGNQGTSDDEDPTLGLGLFMSCDISLPPLFNSSSMTRFTNNGQGSSSGTSSGFSSKFSKTNILSQLQQSKQSQLYSQIPQASTKGNGIGDGNSLRNQLAVQSMRDISSYDVKKVKFANSDKENESGNEDAEMAPVETSKQKRVALKNKKQEEFDKQRDKVVSFLDLNEETTPASGKLAKQVAQ